MNIALTSLYLSIYTCETSDSRSLALRTAFWGRGQTDFSIWLEPLLTPGA